MPQFVLEDNDELRFWRVFKGIAAQTFADLDAYYKDAYQSPELGAILYDQKRMPIYSVLARDLFVKSYAAILAAQKHLGTVGAYLEILYGIFGKDAEITITTTPLHLKIGIVAVKTRYFVWLTRDGIEVTTKDGKTILFGQLLAEVNDRQLLQILKSMKLAGQSVDFTLNEEEGA